MSSRLLLLATCLMAVPALSEAQSVLFDFENANVYTPLPINLTVGPVTAHFSYQSYGYSIQAANTTFMQPHGMSGNYIYPSTVYRDDLYVSFTPPITEWSMMYSPQELACGTSARMRVTAYSGNTLVGTSTTTAPGPGTWPTGQLAFNSSTPFDRVVVHYDAPPPSGGDYGVIFLADNMAVTPADGTTTETLAPTSQVLNIGKLDSGGASSLAAFDNKAETVCRYFIPTLTSPMIRLTCNYKTTKTNPTRIEFFTASRTANTGLFSIKLLMENQTYGGYDEVLPMTLMAEVYQFDIGRPYGTTDYIGTGGLMRGRIEIYRTGFSATSSPCFDIDEAVMKVSG